MNGWQERHWLVTRGHRGPATGERRVQDFVWCEVPVVNDTAMALEVFTSWERAEVELRGIERLVPSEYCLRVAHKHRGRSTSGEPDETLSDGVYEFAGY